MGSLILLAVIALLAGPILAIMALVAVRRLDADSSSARLQDLTSRLYALEQQVRRFASSVSSPPASREVRATTEPPQPSEPTIRIEIPPSTAEQAAEVPTAAALPPPVPPRPASPAVPAVPFGSSAPTRLGVSPGVLQGFSHDQKVSPLDLESVIAGKWFNRIGIVALLIAVSYFLKLAFDNNWIGPTGRVAIGILLGALMLPWSHWLLGRGYSYFSEGIAALGEATLFVSVWAGCQYYSLYSRSVGFAAMIAITAVMAAIAIGRDSQRIAVLSLLGGLLAPILASSGRDEQVVLFTYLLFLGAGALVIAAKKEWRSLPLIAFIGTQIYFWGWYSEFFHRTSPTERTVLFASLFFFLYSVLPIRTAMRGIRLSELDILILLATEFAYSVTLLVLLWPDDRWPLTLLFVALATAHVAIARLLPVPKTDESGLARLLYAGLALTYLTLAIPIRLEGNWITLSLAVEGAILVWTGFRAASSFLRQSGYLLLAIAALRLLVFPPEGGAFLFNPRFAAYLALIACFGFALWAARSHVASVAGEERIEIGIFAIAINVFALIALSVEFWDRFGKASTGIEASLAQHLALSVLWTAYASVLLFLGMQSKSALLRWQSLILFGLVVGKVFLYDLSFLERAYRILSFFILGAVLLAVSFLYQRKLAREKESA
jgi:uncharacterized membrane protein